MKSVQFSGLVKVLLIIFILLVVVAAIIFPYFRQNIVTNQTGNNSAFNRFVTNGNQNNEPSQPKRVELSQEDQAKISEFEKFLTTPREPITDETSTAWDWETQMFTADVRLVERDKGLIYIRAQDAYDHDINRRTVPIEISCTLNETAIYYYGNMEQIAAGVDIFDYVDQGDTIYTYCANYECASVNRLCILIDKQDPNAGEPVSETPPDGLEENE